jgi:hypothetical protein
MKRLKLSLFLIEELIDEVCSFTSAQINNQSERIDRLIIEESKLFAELRRKFIRRKR